MATYQPRLTDFKRQWFLVDAADVVLGRLATHVVNLLTGKGKPVWTPFLDVGDHVIIVNAEKVRLTGNKLEQKIYYRHSGYPGGIKAVKAKDFRSKRADRMVEVAVKGMLPKNRLGRAMAKKLKVYRGDTHPHSSQRPEISMVQG
jgi:large subunit ribosomal protein L13